MRAFDARLLEILKTETEYEKKLKVDPVERERFMKVTKDHSGDPETYAELNGKVSVGRISRYADWPAHRSCLLEMVYVCSGTMMVNVAGQEILLRRGDFFMPNQYTSVERHALGENDIAVCFVMTAQYLEECCVRLKTKTILSDFMLDTLRRDVSWNRYLHFQAVDDIAVHNLAETIIYASFPYLSDDNIRCGSAPDPEITAMTMTALFSSLSRDLTALAPESPTNYDEVIRQTVVNYISSNYKTASLRELAGMVNQSESALSRQVKNIFGFNFKDLLLQKRFERAVVLLQQTDLSVADVADAVGYENTSFFYRRFRALYGVSPKDFRGGDTGVLN